MAAPAAALLPTRTSKPAAKAATSLAPSANHAASQQPVRQLHPLHPALPANPSAIPADAPDDRDSHQPEPDEKPLRLQRKLAVGASDDPLESEADRAANAVMQMQIPPPANVHGPLATSSPSPSREPALRRKCACGGTCNQCEEDRNELLHRKANGDIGPTQAPAIVHDVLRSPGRPLDSETRSFMETRFAQDFRHIRIHTDAAAAHSATAVNALAYTVGHQIVFGAGQYAPTTSASRHLLAHELAHTVQQSRPSGNAARPSPSPEIALSQSPQMVARETPEEKAAAVEDEVLNRIAMASLTADNFGIAPTNPVWSWLSVLWMVRLLKVLETADKRGQLAALDQHVDRAEGGVKERLRLAIDAVKLRRGKDRITELDPAFLTRLQVLPEQQRKEISDYLTGGNTRNIIRLVTPEEKAKEAQMPSFQDYLNPQPRPKNIPQPKPESPVEKFVREHQREILELPLWDKNFASGLGESALNQKLGDAWEQFKNDMSSPTRFVSFYMGMQIGIPIGAVKDIYNQLEGVAQLMLLAMMLDMQLKVDPLKVWQDIKKFGQTIPQMLLRLFNPKQLGLAAGNALAAKVDQEFVKKGAFDQGQVIGEIMGMLLMEIALLFIGVEEVSAAAKALKATVIGEEVAHGLALTSKELKVIVEARGALKVDQALTEGAAKEAKLLEGADKSVTAVGKDAAHATDPPIPGAQTPVPEPKPATAVGKPDILEGVTPQTRAAFNSEANKPLKKALEDNPLAARLLKRCQSLCYPDFVTPEQIARLEKILEDAEKRGIHINFKGLQEEVRNPALKTAQDFDRTLNEVDLQLQKQKDLAEAIHDSVGPPRDERVNELTQRQSAKLAKERFNRIAEFRRQNNLPPYRQLQGSSGTVAMVEVEEQVFFGSNSTLSQSVALSQAERELWFNRLKGQGRLKGLKNLSEAQFLSHAEAGSLIKAYEKSGAETLPEAIDLFVDRPTCNDCRANLRDLAEALGVKNMHIYYVGQSGPPVLVTGW